VKGLAFEIQIMAPKVYIGLIHYPVTDKQGNLVATSITNLDIHDISRSCRTYGISKYFLVTPLETQHWLAQRIIRHWDEGWGATYNPNRKEALNVIEICPDIGALADKINAEAGATPVWVVTSAKKYPNTVTFQDLRGRIESNLDSPICLLFGTGWGLHPEIIADADLILEPITGPTEYNHLSVRAAVAIILDRLLAPAAK
jgi:hypothetical protein